MTQIEREDALLEYVRHKYQCRKSGRPWHESHRGFCDCGLEPVLAALLGGRTPRETCQWAIDDHGGDSLYQTSCGHSFEFNDVDDGLNGFRFCGYCGGKIDEARTSDPPVAEPVK